MATTPHLATPTDAEQLAAANKAHRKVHDQLEAAEAQVADLTARLHQVERTIHAYVSSRTVTAKHRLALLGLLVGTRKLPPEYSPGAHAVQVRAEERLLTNYRALSGPNRQVVSRLARQLAEADRIIAKKGPR